MSEVIRLVVFQIECHPAFVRDRLATLQEPFFPESYEKSLSYLGLFQVPVTDMQMVSRAQYEEWHRIRLVKLLSNPLLKGGMPSVIVFPEGSIPVSCLEVLSSFAAEYGAIIVAGSHTILDTIEARSIYSRFGKSDTLTIRHTNQPDVAFVFSGSEVHSHKKQGISPYDRCDITPLAEGRPTIHPIPIRIGELTLRLVTLVCADALQLPKIKGDYDIVSIISFDKNPNNFDQYIETQVQNGKLVLYCNDGRFGGSSINCPHDKRPISWFLNAPLSGKLLRGDSVLVVDVPTGGLATQVGVTNPKAQWEVKKLASVTYEQSLKMDHLVSKELLEIGDQENNDVRHSRIDALLKQKNYNENQKCRLEQLKELSRLGNDSKGFYDVYGSDLILDLEGLVDLESKLSKACFEKLSQEIVSLDLAPETLKPLQSFLRSCKQKILQAGSDEYSLQRKLGEVREDPINREEEVEAVLRFCDSRREFFLEVSGLAQVGKSATIEKALGRTSFKRIKKIPILSTSSAEYIAKEIAGVEQGNSSAVSSYAESLGQNLPTWDLVWIHSAHELVTSWKWKSVEVEQLVKDLLHLSCQNGVKVIFETSFALPFELDDPSLLAKIRIYGFEGNRGKHGVAILDRQLRRLNFRPSDLPDDTKNVLVERLGGHPLAIIFCADAIFEEGLTAVLTSIEKGIGFYRQILERILQIVPLSENEITVLRVIAGCRIEVARDAIASACDFPAVDIINKLCQLCLIEVVTPDSIRLPGILRSRFRFSELSEEIRVALHKAAIVNYKRMAEERSANVAYAIEADYHSVSIGKEGNISTGLVDGRVAAAKTLYEAHDFDKARNVLEPVLNDKAPTDILRLSALIDAEAGYLGSAIPKAEKVFGRNPSDGRLFFQLGKAALTQSRLELGDRLVDIGRSTGVRSAWVLVLEGRLALRRRDFEKAQDCFRRATRSGRPDPWAFFYLGNTYMKMGELGEAINVLYEGDQYLAQGQRHFDRGVWNAIRTKLAIAYVFNGDLQPASTLLEDLRAKNPNNPDVLYASWLLTVRRDGVNRAEEAFEIFRSARPARWERGQYHLYYGLFLTAVDRIDEANEQFRLGHEAEPAHVYIMMQYAESLYTLAVRSGSTEAVKLSEGYALRCARVVRRIFDFDPDNPTAENLQIELYSMWGIELSKVDK